MKISVQSDHSKQTTLLHGFGGLSRCYHLAAMAFPCCNNMSEEEQAAADRSKKIEKQVKKYDKEEAKVIKILLLGAGESGKSTFLKQMKIINGEKFTEDQLKEYRAIIYGNIIRGMKVLVDARVKLGIRWGNQANAAHARLVMGHDNSVALEPPVFLHYLQSCRELWKDHGIREAFDRRGEFHLVRHLNLIRSVSFLSIHSLTIALLVVTSQWQWIIRANLHSSLQFCIIDANLYEPLEHTLKCSEMCVSH